MPETMREGVWSRSIGASADEEIIRRRPDATEGEPRRGWNRALQGCGEFGGQGSVPAA